MAAIRSEKRTGTTTAGREKLRTVLDFLRSGDVLMVRRIDRLARSVRAVKAKGATLKATEQPIDTSNRSRQVLPRHAGSVRRVRDQPAERTPA
jgi:DNA invertase Pin-like site-specific DNA recombinase